MDNIPKEARILMALEAIKKSEKLSVLAAAKIYDVSETTLRSRRNGRLTRRDIPANSRKLTDLEEKTIV